LYIVLFVCVLCVFRGSCMHHRKLLLESTTAGGCGAMMPGLLNMNSLQKLPELDKSLSTSDTLVSSPFRRPSQMLVGWRSFLCLCVCMCMRCVYEYMYGHSSIYYDDVYTSICMVIVVYTMMYILAHVCVVFTAYFAAELTFLNFLCFKNNNIACIFFLTVWFSICPSSDDLK